MSKLKTNLNAKWLFLGLVGFAAGFFGPMIFAPGANQGPLLGIFITGPVGFLMGLVLWSVSKIFNLTPKTQHKIFNTVGALLILSVVAVALKPEPDWLGYIYKIEVTSCRPASGEVNAVIQDWNSRLAKRSLYPARSGWQEDVKRILSLDKGSLIETTILMEKFVRNDKPLFKKNKINAFLITTKEPQKRSFYISETCEKMIPGFKEAYFVPTGSMHVMPNKNSPWPPQIVSDLLVKEKLVSVPDYLKEFLITGAK
jgi:hypothetical protein